MTQVQRIVSELQRSLMGPAWHGESVFELLTGVTGRQASARPLAGAHTIHEIVLHLTTWVELASAALHGREIPEWPFSEDWPATDGSKWDQALENLRQSTLQLAAYTERLSEERLEQPTPGRTYSLGVLLLGIVQHAAYHGGQIALLKKLSRV